MRQQRRIADTCSLFHSFSNHFRKSDHAGYPATSKRSISYRLIQHALAGTTSIWRAHPAWQEIVASWALEGIAMTYDDDERAGRMITGHSNYKQVAQEIRARNQQL